MIYEFYSIGSGGPQALAPKTGGSEQVQDKHIIYMGHTNSFSYGLHRFLSSVVDKVPAPTQHMEMDLMVKGNTHGSKDGDCILIFVRAQERLFSAGVRAVDNVKSRGADCKGRLMELYSAERLALTL
jgi:hypothetical protein